MSSIVRGLADFISQKGHLSVSFFGYTCIAVLLIRAFVWLHGLYRPLDLARYRLHGTAWALITGATDGIGLGFAEELLANGFNVIITGRNPEKLASVKSTLLAAFPKQKVETVCSEASDVSDANIASVVDKAKSRPVTILVNNVGMGQVVRDRIEAVPADVVRKLVSVNCTYPTLLTRAMLPLMHARKSAVAVINVASVAGLVPNPFGSLYGASKAFNDSFSVSTSADYPDVDVLSVCPGFVATNMTGLSESALVCGPRSCARYSLKRLGDVACLPHPTHAGMYGIAYVLLKLLPLKFGLQAYKRVRPILVETIKKRIAHKSD